MKAAPVIQTVVINLSDGFEEEVTATNYGATGNL